MSTPVYDSTLDLCYPQKTTRRPHSHSVTLPFVGSGSIIVGPSRVEGDESTRI